MPISLSNKADVRQRMVIRRRQLFGRASYCTRLMCCIYSNLLLGSGKVISPQEGKFGIVQVLVSIFIYAHKAGV